MKWIFQRFFYPAKVCDMPRIQCAACSGFAVRHAPDSVCDMLRIMQIVDGQYSEGGKWEYIKHPKYANSPEQYIRAFLLLQKDLQLLFDYVEPSEINLTCYSYRIHELLLRACVEVEANCKAILLENGYQKDAEMNMTDYKKD